MCVADMHTHSEWSHDSVCPIEEMCKAQIARGTRYLAVTDHCDGWFFSSRDVFTPVQRSYETVQTLKVKYAGPIELLAGVEISEGYWYPDFGPKAETLCDYDLIIGSVHCVEFEGKREPYSIVDFSKMDTNALHAYLDAYFNHIFTMLDRSDFDVLAHLTCPLRYIVGKFGRAVDMARYADTIEAILRAVIEQGKALEINTSSYGVMGEFMPSTDILRRYFEMGGRLITIGSDAHASENAAQYFDEAIDTLKAIGFTHIYYYKGRKAYPIEI